MNKGLWTPLVVLAAILTCSLWNGSAMTKNTTRWRSQLQTADILAQGDHWADTETVLERSYTDWSSRQTWLHIVTQHAAVDDAEAMYRRAMAFAAVQEINEFRAEIADLQDQLRLLAEMEQFSIKNVL